MNPREKIYDLTMKLFQKIAEIEEKITPLEKIYLVGRVVEVVSGKLPIDKFMEELKKFTL